MLSNSGGVPHHYQPVPEPTLIFWLCSPRIVAPSVGLHTLCTYWRCLIWATQLLTVTTPWPWNFEDKPALYSTKTQQKSSWALSISTGYLQGAEGLFVCVLENHQGHWKVLPGTGHSIFFPINTSCNLSNEEGAGVSAWPGVSWFLYNPAARLSRAQRHSVGNQLNTFAAWHQLSLGITAPFLNWASQIHLLSSLM